MMMMMMMMMIIIIIIIVIIIIIIIITNRPNASIPGVKSYRIIYKADIRLVELNYSLTLKLSFGLPIPASPIPLSIHRV